jgi:hypothetical protein
MGCGFSQPTTSNGGALLTFAHWPVSPPRNPSLTLTVA